MNAELSPRASEIAAHTRTLLATGGYHGFSYADIADRVRISKASIHHHFPSKAELVQTVVATYRQEARAGLAGLDERVDDPLMRLEAYLLYWSTCILDSTAPLCICAMLAAELPTIPDEVAEEVQGHFKDLASWLAAVLKKGAATGQFKLHGSAESAAQSFMATVHGAMLSARALGHPKNFIEITKPALRALAAVR